MEHPYLILILKYIIIFHPHPKPKVGLGMCSHSHFQTNTKFLSLPYPNPGMYFQGGVGWGGAALFYSVGKGHPKTSITQILTILLNLSFTY